MAIPKFFYNTEPFMEGVCIRLSDEEARHASLSRRLQVNDEVMLLDGIGNKALGKFTELNKRVAKVFIEKIEHAAITPTDIAVASAIPKGDRQKLMLDMLTQLGVTTFIPLNCEFSSTKATEKSIEKWQRIVVEACKQSGNPYLMNIQSSNTIPELIDSTIWNERLVFQTDQHAEKQIKEVNEKILVVIGPEGGLSDQESTLLRGAGAKGLNLGPHILRTETAAVSAVAKFV